MKKIGKIAVFLVALIAVAGVYGVIAYLTDTKEVTNVFSVGNVSITLTEPSWVEANGKDILPGKVIANDPTITNVGNNSAYVYMKVEVPKVTLKSGEGALFTYTVNEAWKEITSAASDTDTTITKVYYYNSALEKTEDATLFESVTVADYAPTIDNSQSIKVTGYAIQSENLATGTDIPGAYTANFAS